MRNRPPIALRLSVPLTQDDRRVSPPGRIGPAVLNVESRLAGVRNRLHAIGRDAFCRRHRDGRHGDNRWARRQVRHVFMFLAEAWDHAAWHDFGHAEMFLEMARGALQDLAQAPDIERGRKFKPAGRGKGKLRTLIEREVGKLDGLSARQAWDRLGDMSARRRMSIEFYDDHAYLPGEPTVSFRRFENLLSEIRRARK